MDELDDLALLKKYAREDSDAAFAELVTRHINLVYSAALRQTQNPALAEEITQAVFILLAQKASRIHEKTILAGWLFRTTRFTALASIRAQTKQFMRQATIEKELQMQNQPPSAAGEEFWNQISPLLDDALAALGKTDRQAIILRFIENKTLSEVGNRLGTNEEAARKRVSRALEKMHRYFNRHGVNSTTAILAGEISTHSLQTAPVGLAKIATTAALAKGITASASTLVLVKGTLKLMLWSKTKTALLTAACLFVVIGTVTVKNKYFPSEPSYHGRKLSAWVLDIGYDQPADKRALAYEAIRHMGAKTLPFLVADLANPPKTDRNYFNGATWAFDALGPVGKPAIPQLVKLMEQNPGYAPSALAGIGRDALPELLNSLTNGSFWVRDNAAAALANGLFSHKFTSEEASAAFPIALSNLTYDNTNALFRDNTRMRAAGLLEALALKPDISVPALMKGLQDTNLTVAANCAGALGGFRTNAMIAIPALEKAAGSTNRLLSVLASQSLTEINPHNPPTAAARQ